jgi:Protein of unknown function (DUF1554)
MTLAIRNAILTTLLLMPAITAAAPASGQEIKIDIADLQRQVLELQQAFCKLTTDEGVSGLFDCRLFYAALPPKRVFVTGAAYNGNLGGLAGADAKCQEQAYAAFLGGTYKAWLSDHQVNARDRLAHYSGPYRLVNGILVALSWTDLVDGILQNGIDKNASGYYPPNNTPIGGAWTGTHTDGTLVVFDPAFDTCSDWTSSANRGENWTRGLRGLKLDRGLDVGLR